MHLALGSVSRANKNKNKMQRSKRGWKMFFLTEVAWVVGLQSDNCTK